MEITKSISRESIIGMQEYLKIQEGSVIGDSDRCPLAHRFTDGIYVREIMIPAGTPLVGKIHRHDHPNFLMSGTVRMITEDGPEEITGPKVMISKAGVKRALFAVTDLVWVTVHHNPTNTQDLKKIEKFVIADSYEEFDRSRLSIVQKITLFFKKLLNN